MAEGQEALPFAKVARVDVLLARSFWHGKADVSLDLDSLALDIAINADGSSNLPVLPKPSQPPGSSVTVSRIRIGHASLRVSNPSVTVDLPHWEGNAAPIAQRQLPCGGSQHRERFPHLGRSAR